VHKKYVSVTGNEVPLTCQYYEYQYTLKLFTRPSTSNIT